MTEHKLWYIKRGDEVKGPFPGKVVTQHLLVGRYKQSDLVSIDAKQWQTLGDVEELVPAILRADSDDPDVQAELAVAKRWADERLAIDRRTEHGPTDHPDRRGVERRGGEDLDTLAHREAKTEYIVGGRNNRQRQQAFLLVILVLVSGLAWWVSGLEPAPAVEPSDCLGQPAPGINWNSCSLRGSSLYKKSLAGAQARNVNLSGSDMELIDFVGADLAYSDLSLSNLTRAKLTGANLVGVDFQRSVLVGANLDNADAAYANFLNTDLSRVSMSNTHLGRAVWVDGTVCAPNSVGKCIPTGEVRR